MMLSMMKKEKGKDFESAELRITRGYLVGLPAKPFFFIDKAASFGRRGRAASPFSVFLRLQESADTADDVIAFVGHLCVEVDVRDA